MIHYFLNNELPKLAYLKRSLLLESIEIPGKFYLIDGHHNYYTYYIGLKNHDISLPCIVLKFNKTPYNSDKENSILLLKILQLAIVLCNQKLKLKEINNTNI